MKNSSHIEKPESWVGKPFHAALGFEIQYGHRSIQYSDFLQLGTHSSSDGSFITELLFHPELSWLVLEVDVKERDHLYGVMTGAYVIRSVSQEEGIPLIVSDDPEGMVEYAKSFGSRSI